MSDDALPATLRHLLAALVQSALLADDAKAAEARRTAIGLHGKIHDLATPDSLAALRLDGLWSAAVREAETADLMRAPLHVSPQLPAICPLSPGDLVGPALAFPELEQRIRDSAATG